jgi:cell wall-associated NlpC family hydrolase
VSAIFADQTRIDAMAVSLARWRNTPFVQHAAQPGVGVDCVHFVREVYRDCGIDVSAADEIPRYALGWGVHSEHSRLLGWLLESPEARGRLRHLPPSAPVIPGDLVAIRHSQSVHHIGVIGPEIPPRLWHVAIPAGVTSLDWAGARAALKIVVILRLQS